MLSFADSVKYSMTEYASLYPTLGQCLDHMFGVIGNGMQWDSGSLSEGDDAIKLAALPALERAACQPPVYHERVPNWLRYPLKLHTYEKIRPLHERLADGTITSLYGISQYSSILYVPDDVPQDWFNGAYTYVQLVQQTPKERTIRSRMCQTDKEREYAEKEYQSTQEKIANVKADLERRFPKFVSEFQSVVGNISIDPNRPDYPGMKYWPLDGSTVPLADLVMPFKDALEFCYRFEPRTSSPKSLKSILMRAGKAAILLGQKSVMEDVRRDFSWNKNTPPAIVTVLQNYLDLPATGWFETETAPFVNEIKANYRRTRRNINKNIPYNGYPLGHNSRGGSLEPVADFTVEGLRYNHHDQGRDPLETIVGKLFTVVSEQGIRILQQEFIQASKDLPVQKTYEEEMAEFEEGIRNNPSAVAALQKYVEELS